MSFSKSDQRVDVWHARGACALEEVVDRLSSGAVCGYQGDAAPATEPTALAALALLHHGKWQAAGEALDWLAAIQSDEGSLGIDAEHGIARWPTAWAVLAWQLAVHQFATHRAAEGRWRPAFGDLDRWSQAAGRAVGWLQSLYGERVEMTPFIGHNTRLRGWPWVETTHSWVEPTAVGVLALKSADLGDGPRAREAVRLLLDRMIPTGGWNHANKIVLGKTLRPLIQPTGLALAALHGEDDAARFVTRSLAYLNRTVSARTATASLCYAILGAAAHGVQLPAADRHFAAAAARTLEGDAAPYKLALLAWAATSLATGDRVGRT